MSYSTYRKIKTITATTSQASIEFTDIPQIYDDIVIKISGRCTTDVANGKITINASTSNFSSRILEADGSSAYSASRSDNLNLFLVNPSSYTASTFGSSEIYFSNYTSSTNKSFNVDATTENNATASVSRMSAGLWSNNSAITTIKLETQGTAFATNSTATLYGIKRGTA